jgi:hypothetical protein
MQLEEGLCNWRERQMTESTPLSDEKQWLVGHLLALRKKTEGTNGRTGGCTGRKEEGHYCSTQGGGE